VNQVEEKSQLAPEMNSELLDTRKKSEESGGNSYESLEKKCLRSAADHVN